MKKVDVDSFIQWQRAKKERTVTVIYGSGNIDNISVFVYDNSLKVGQYAQSVGEINLDRIKEQEEKREYERLRAKFEPKKLEAVG